MPTINTKAFRPLGVSRHGRGIALVGAVAFSGKQKLSLAIGAGIGDGLMSPEDLLLVLPNGSQVDATNITAVRISVVAHQQIVSFSMGTGKRARLGIARRVDDNGLVSWETGSPGSNQAGHGQVVPEYRHIGQYVLIHGLGELGIAFSKDLHSWSDTMPLAGARAGFFDRSAMELVGASYTRRGILAFYQVRTIRRDDFQLLLGAILLDKENPTKVLWRSDTPLWESAKYGKKRDNRLVGAYMQEGKLLVYECESANELHAYSLGHPLADPEVQHV